ncbi:unnamed protein product [Adineta steineri]|uniref:Uncharacterized protein n=1 Tax=Adineta steineri TaxID=433720 RepID=A0A820J1C3_9BILA|nr:unnamed protein product [Adineta steineri]
MTNSSNTLDSKPNNIEMQDFESNSIALYNQQILQILCSDTLELEIELARDSHQSSFEILPQSSTHDHTLTSYYSTWAALWRDVTVEYLQFNSNKCLKKVMIDNFKHDNHSWSIRENDRILNEITKQQRNLKKPIIKSYKINENNFCLHYRLMFEIKQNKQLKPSEKSLTIDSNRKRIHPIQKLIESDSSSDDDAYRDEYGRKRVIVVDCLLESSPEDNTTSN